MEHSSKVDIYKDKEKETSTNIFIDFKRPYSVQGDDYMDFDNVKSTYQVFLSAKVGADKSTSMNGVHAKTVGSKPYFSTIYLQKLDVPLVKLEEINYYPNEKAAN